MDDHLKPERITDNSEGVSLDDVIQDGKEALDKERKEKWPFARIYNALNAHQNLDTMYSFETLSSLGVVSKAECTALRKRIRGAFKGISCLHYTTMKRSPDDYEGSAALGFLGGGAGGAWGGAVVGTAVGGPLGTLVGGLAGCALGMITGSSAGRAVTHGIYKTIGRSRKKHLEALDENLRLVSQLSEGLEAKIKKGRISEGDLTRLDDTGRRSLVWKRESALDSLKRLKGCYPEYMGLVSGGGYDGR